MSKIPNPPRIHLTLSIEEALSICWMVKCGPFARKPKTRHHVQAVLSRIGKKFEALGLDHDRVEKLVKL